MKVNLAETQDLLVFYLVLLCIHVGHLGAYFALIGLIPALKNFLCIFIKFLHTKVKSHVLEICITSKNWKLISLLNYPLLLFLCETSFSINNSTVLSVVEVFIWVQSGFKSSFLRYIYHIFCWKWETMKDFILIRFSCRNLKVRTFFSQTIMDHFVFLAYI